MTSEIRDLSGSRFEQVNLAGSRVHGAFLIGTRVTDAWVHSLDVSGNVESLVVNGVEVAGYVRAELERRHPELGYLEAHDVPGLQRAWVALQDIAAATLEAAPRCHRRRSTNPSTANIPICRPCATSCSQSTVGSRGRCSVRPTISTGSATPTTAHPERARTARPRRTPDAR